MKNALVSCNEIIASDLYKYICFGLAGIYEVCPAFLKISIFASLIVLSIM